MYYMMQALERNPAVCRALNQTADWEVASHGYRWMDYRTVDEETERDHIWRSVQIHEKLIGKRPVGFYQGKVRKEHVVEKRMKGVSAFGMQETTPSNSCVTSAHTRLLLVYCFVLCTMCSPMAIRGAWSCRKAASNMIRIRTRMICPIGRSTTANSRT